MDPAGRTLALFDIDGTLTTRDTMFAYAEHTVGQLRLVAVIALLAPLLALARFGLVDRGRAKGTMMRWLYRGRTRTQLEAAAVSFCRDVLPGLLRKNGLVQLRKHREDGHHVLLVSASLDLWLRPFAEAEGIPLHATSTGWSNNRFIGLGGPNCRGPEKVRRIRAVVDPDAFDRVVAYGDSSGDTEMLALAADAHFKPFRDTSE